MASLAVKLTVIFAIFVQAFGLFEDQAGKFDWHHQYVGEVSNMAFDESTQGGRRLFVATKANVLAAIHSKHGKLGWRHVMEMGPAGSIDSFIHQGEKLLTVSGGGSFIRYWNPSVGILDWEVGSSSASSGRTTAALMGKNNDLLAVLSGDSLRAYKMSSGKEVWNIQLPNSESTDFLYLYSLGEQLVLVGVSKNSHVTVLTYKDDSTLVSQKNVQAGWVNTDTECKIIRGSHLVCLDGVMGGLQILDLKEATTFKLTLVQDYQVNILDASFVKGFGEITADTVAAVRFRHSHIILFRIEGSSAKLLQNLEGTPLAHVTQYQEREVLLTISSPVNGVMQQKAVDLAQSTEVSEFTRQLPYPAHHGLPIQVTAALFKKRDGSTGYRVAVLGEDHSLHLYQQSGKAHWFREEALASIVSAEIIDLPLSDNLVELEAEFSTTGNNILNDFLKRLGSQAVQLQTTLLELKERLTSSQPQGDPDDLEVRMQDSQYLRRDTFSLHKMVVVATAASKVFGIDSYTGQIVWQQFVRDLVPYERNGHQSLPMFLQRTAAHLPHRPQITIVGKHRSSDTGLMYAFDPISGEEVVFSTYGGFATSYHIIQAMMVQQPDQNVLKPLVLLDSNREIHVFPKEDEKYVKSLLPFLFMYTTDPDTGTLKGYRLNPSSSKAQLVWTVDLQAEGQVITNVVPKSSAEHVHSQGIILGDRSVMYKYLNPNLIAVTTEGVDNQGKPMVTVYLLDAITGHMIFHCNHRRSSGPVLVVHSENWVVYTYWNQKNRRNEMAVLELFEGKQQSNATSFSSFDPPPQPIVMRQSFIFPGHISAMGVSVTEKGITDKHLLIALQSGGILELPKGMVDPRRPSVLTPELREEGMMPYIPELPRPFEAMINYNRSLYNIRGIQTCPAGLESTSLVLVYGLDVFYTRITPSKMFDVLKEDFDYFFISSVVIGMFLVSFISQKLAGRRALSRAWK